MKLVKKVVKINQMKMFGCPFYHISDLFSVRIRVPSRALILHEKDIQVDVLFRAIEALRASKFQEILH